MGAARAYQYDTDFEYLEDTDPISGAPTITAVPKTVRAAREGVPYSVINSWGDLFKREHLREAWRIFRRNDPFPYQLEVADAILYSALNGLGWFFVIMITRQAGKNEISAFIQQYILLYGALFKKQVSGVKFAPVHKPQVQASMDRLEGADAPDSGGLAGSVATRSLWSKSDGYKYHVGTPRDSNKIAFLSINPNANVASQTAYTLLEGDEAQDIDENKWERDAAPMGSFNNATTVLYGVAWTKESFIYKGMQQAYEMERRIEDEMRRAYEAGESKVKPYRPRLVFKIDAHRVIADGNDNYRKAFMNQLARLGENHIAIQTQYLLNFMDSIGRFFDPDHRARMYANSYRMRQGPLSESVYLFAIDQAGQEENPTTVADEVAVGQHKRDAQTLIIGELMKDGTIIPVCIYYWVGKAHSELKSQILTIIKHWRCIGGTIDATGLGEPLAYYLIERLPRLFIEAYKFKAQGDENKSKLGYMAYHYVFNDLLKIPRRPVGGDPQQQELWDELQWQIENLVRVAKKQQMINWHVPPNAKPRREGHVPHDDLVTTLFLLMRAAYVIRDPEARKASAFQRQM